MMMTEKEGELLVLLGGKLVTTGNQYAPSISLARFARFLQGLIHPFPWWCELGEEDGSQATQHTV